MLATPLVVATNQALTDSDVQAQVRQMHADDMPLLEMVDALGLGGNLTPEIRGVLQDLSPDVVASIRQATLDALDNGRTQMPLACGISDADLESAADVNVEVAQTTVGPTILVLPS
jgi:hypothetical protein